MDSPRCGMNASPNNPVEIIEVLDSHMDHEVYLVLYGRASLALGFAEPRAACLSTKDVDAIIRFSQLDDMENDLRFWDAVDATNEALAPRGLYITHLFGEEQVFLRPEWEQHIVPVRRPPTRWLRLFRPHTVDLILTKMMRGNDEQDMEDIRFLIEHDGITVAQMEPAFATVRMPDVIELHEAFARALPAVRSMLPG